VHQVARLQLDCPTPVWQVAHLQLDCPTPVWQVAHLQLDCPTPVWQVAHLQLDWPTPVWQVAHLQLAARTATMAMREKMVAQLSDERSRWQAENAAVRAEVDGRAEALQVIARMDD
jgi:hypothetical protein